MPCHNLLHIWNHANVRAHIRITRGESLRSEYENSIYTYVGPGEARSICMWNRNDEYANEQPNNGNKNKDGGPQYEGNLLKMAANQKFQFQPYYENKI